MYQVIKKLTRPNLDTPWPNIEVSISVAHSEHLNVNYLSTGKHIFRNIEDDVNGLERTLTVLWESKDVYEEFVADSLMQEMRDNISQKFKDSGISENIVSLSEI